MTRVVSVVVVCGFMVCSALAYPGNELLEDCKLYLDDKLDGSDGIKATVCMAYVAGVLDSVYEWQQSTGKRTYCIPPESTQRQHIMVIVQHLVVMASKRMTHSGSLLLPDGEMLNLREAVYFSRVGNQLTVSTPRHYRGSITQQVTKNTEIEFAAYC